MEEGRLRVLGTRGHTGMQGGMRSGALCGVPSERWVPVGWRQLALRLPLACQWWTRAGPDPGAVRSSALPSLGWVRLIGFYACLSALPLGPGSAWRRGWVHAGPEVVCCVFPAGWAGGGSRWSQTGIAARALYSWVGGAFSEKTGVIFRVRARANLRGTQFLLGLSSAVGITDVRRGRNVRNVRFLSDSGFV